MKRYFYLTITPINDKNKNKDYHKFKYNKKINIICMNDEVYQNF